MTEAIEVVAETERAQVLLHPTRLRILELLTEPASAASLAPRLELPRQLVNYHLRELLRVRLVVLAEERTRGSVSERIYRRVGDSYAIAPQALGAMGDAPAALQDRYSSAYQIGMASRVLHDVAALRTAAAAAKKALPTFSLEVDVRFADAAARSAFTQELADAVAALVQRHHDARSPGGRTFRFFLGAHPRPAARRG
ncbi:MAG: helix-turn-helix domain-containing protein [Planctomycetota bacterium]